ENRALEDYETRQQATAPECVARHALAVAQIVARLLRHDSEYRERLPEITAGALLIDAGMLNVPEDAWLHENPLSPEQRRSVEGHVRAGVELAVRLAPEATWLHRAAAAHHERPDGTGYPAGQRGDD